MSASLVGSEMCIRDSPPRNLSSVRHADVTEERAAKEYMTEAEMERATVPVSYTHLTLPTICSV
eukprot:202903-Alexandrium_andersonii.AAC.1